MTAPQAPPLAPMIDKLARRSGLTPTQVDVLLALPHRIVRSEAGTYLVREGDHTDTCIALVSGFVYRSKIAGDGSRQILSIHLRGDLVDLDNSLLPEADHSIQALTRVDAAHIPQQAILDMAAAHPAIARALWRETVVDGSILREWVLNLGQRNARQRIAHLLCELALRQEAAALCSGPQYEWPMTQEQIGDATGLTPVHVNRTVRAMRGDGLIDTNRRLVTVLDWQRLQAAGDFRRAYLHQGAPVPA